MNKELAWLTNELEILLEMIESSKLEGDRYSLEWPIDPPNPLPLDLINTSRLLNQITANSEFSCYLDDLSNILEGEKRDLNWGFTQFHCAAHILLLQKMPNVVPDELKEDEIFVELVASFVGAMAMHRYFGMPYLTGYMAERLSELFVEQGRIEKEIGEKWSNKDASNAMKLVFDAFLEREKKILH